MEKLIPITIPLLNPNEPEALLATLEASEGKALEKGEVIAVIETTKSTGEIQADAPGYLVGLRFKEGDSLHAGEVLAYISETPTAQDPSLSPWAAGQPVKPGAELTALGLRITAPARELALQEGLDLDSMPHGTLVTRQMVWEQLKGKPAYPSTEVPEGENRIVIYGAGGHGRSLAAMIRILGTYEIIGYLDDGVASGETVSGLKVLGGHEVLPGLKKDGICMAVNGVGGIGDLQARLSVYEHLAETGFHCPSVVHPTAFLEDSAAFSDGIQVYPFAYVGTDVRIGYGCLINTGAIISHDCSLAQYVNLSPGATLAGGVTIDEGALIGMRTTVNLSVHIGKRARIGNGATVKTDVPDGGVVPAGTIWPPRH